MGLRDILDDSKVICKDWKQKGVYRYLDSLYDEIWVYGNKDIYNPIEQYRIPDSIKEKVFFTGYIPRKKISADVRNKIRKEFRIFEDDIFILVTTGGGGDGSEVLENYVALHDQYPVSLPYKSVMITGPFMPKEKRESLRNRAQQYGIETLPFHPRMEELMKAADLVISMGGYNTFCEILTQGTPALIIPRESPRQEQLIRAQCMYSRGLIDYIPWTKVNPTLLREKIVSMLSQSPEYKEKMSNFVLSGLDSMRDRLTHFRENNIDKNFPPNS